ncbi:MAG: FG-GAP-like repeat-containing protein [Tepidisphaeraceae bacterium]|jgi:ankyrin repeat protein
MSISCSRRNRRDQAVSKALRSTAERCVCESLENRQLLAAALPAVSVIAIVPNASEDGVNGVFRVMRSGGNSKQALNISYTLAGTAIPSLDYVRPTTIRIPANQPYVSVPIQPINDHLVEGTENVVFRLLKSTVYKIGAPSAATVYIADATPAVLSITPVQSTASDAPGHPATFVISRTGNTGSDIRVNYSTSGTAVAGTDYAFIGDIIIPAGQNSVTVNINPAPTSQVEPDRTVVFTILPSTDYQLGAASTFTATIVDANAPIVNLVVSDGEATKPNTPGSVTITRFGNQHNDTPLSFTLSGTAIVGQDYQNITSIVIPAGQDSVVVPIIPKASGIITGDTTVIVTLTPGSGYTLGSTISGTVVIHDNLLPRLSVTATDAVASAPSDPLDTATFTVTRFGDTQQLIRLMYSLTGTALEGSDYEFVGIVYLLPGEAQIPVDILPIDPSTPVGDRTVIFTILPSAGNYTLDVPSAITAQAVIHDNTAPLITAAASQPDASEPNINGQYTLTRTGDLRQDLTLNFHMEGTAVAGVQYQPITSITIPAGQTTVTVPLTVIDGGVGGADTTATLVVDQGTTYSIDANNSATVTIHNIYGPLVSVTASQPDAYEPGTPINPGSNGEFTVTRLGDDSQDLAVSFHLTGNAVAGTDYQAITDITIPAGQGSVTVPVVPIDNFTVDPLRTVTLVVDTGAGYTPDAQNNSATVTIHDDSPPVVTVAASIPDATVPGVNGQYTLTVTGDWDQAITLNFHMEGTAAKDVDYLGIDSIVIPAPAVPTGTYQITVPLQVLDSGLPNVGDLTATLVLDPGTGYELTGQVVDDSATVTIHNTNTLPLVTVVAAVPTAEEGGGSGVFLFTRYGDLSSALALDPGTDYTMSGTAIPNTDYYSFGRILFSPGEAQVKVYVPPLADYLIEDDETATLTLQPSGNYVLNGQNAASITLYDNDIALLVTKPDASKPVAPYPGSNGEFAIVRGNSSNSQTDVINYTVSGKATLGTDYTLWAILPQDIPVPTPQSYEVRKTPQDTLWALPQNTQLTTAIELSSTSGTITMPAGITEVDVLVVPLAGVPQTEDADIVMTLNPGTNYTLGSTDPTAVPPYGTGTVTLHKDGDSFVSVLATIPNAAKPDGTPAVDGQYTFTRTGDLSTTVVVKYKMSGNAAENIDYDLVGDFTFNPGQSTITVALDPNANNIPTSTQDAILTLDPGEGYAVSGTGSTADITIYDRFPLVTVTASKPNAGEPATNGEFTVTRYGSTATDLSVNYVMQGTADPGSDYVPLGPITIPAGQASVVVPLTVVNDNIHELTETATLFLTPSPTAAYYRDTVHSATVTITDDDPVPVISIAASQPDATEGVTDGAFTITIVGGQEFGFPINFHMTGTAVGGTDYTAITSITVSPGVTQLTIPVHVLLDNSPEGAETATLVLDPSTGASPNYTRGASRSATVTLLAQGAPYVTIVTTDPVATADGSKPGLFTITRTGDTTLAQVVNFTLSGTAVNGTDYAQINQIVIPAGQATVQVPIAAIPGPVGPAKTVILSIAASPDYVEFPGMQSGTVYISPGLTVTATVNPTWEISAPPAVFTITRGSGDLTQPLVVNFIIGGTAVAGTDYQAVPNQVTIPAGEDSAKVRIYAIREDVTHGTKTVTLTLQASGGLTPVVPLNTASIDILDAAQVSVNAYTNIATESGSPGMFNFQRIGDTTGPLVIPYVLTGTATEGVDFQTLGQIVIPAGMVSVDVPLVPFRDLYTGQDEYVTLTILRTADVVPYPQASATITIIEDIPQVSVVATTPTTAEGGAPGVFTFTRVGNLGQAVEINYQVTGSAIQGSDYQTLGHIIIPAGQASLDVDVIAYADDLVEDNETVTIQILNSSNVTAATPSSATITISDMTPPVVSIVSTVGDPQAYEEGPLPGIITFSRIGNDASDLTLSYTLGGTAIEGTDYQTIGTIVFPAHTQTLTIPIMPIDDNIPEPTETVVFTLLASADYAITDRNQVTVNIYDNDLPTVSVVGNDTVGMEGQTPANNGMVTVWRNGDLSQPMTVTLDLSGTAVAGNLVSALTTPPTVDPQSADYYFSQNSLLPATATTLLASDYATGLSPYSVIAADFNGDGKMDLAIANSADDTVSVLLGDGSGGFAAAVNYATGTTPCSIIAADFNGDGMMDLAVANSADNTVSVLLNDGNGVFANHVDYATGTTPCSITAADFNGDGNMDLAVANSADNTVSVLMNDGSGGFAGHVDYATGTTPGCVTAVDVNGDHRMDLVVANTGSNTVSVLLNNGSGGFAAKVDYFTGSAPVSVTAADFNRDGKIDLAVADSASNTVSVLLGNGSGGFAGKVDYATGTTPNCVVAADFNGDGRMDLAVANSASNTVSVLLNNGSGGFAAKADYTTGTTPYSVTAADFNGDGKIDLAVANSLSDTVGVFIGNGRGVLGKNRLQVTIPQEQSFVQIPVFINDNAIPDGTRTAIFTVVPTPGVYLANPSGSSTTVTILDNEVPRLSVMAPIPLATELGLSPGTITIARQGTLEIPLTVSYTLGGTATKGVDYQDPGTIVIPAGAASIDVPITPIDNHRSTGPLTVIFALQASPTQSYSLDPLNANTQATVTIADAEPATVTVAATQPNASESGVQGQYTFTRVGNITNDLPITYQLTGTATVGSDYQALGNIVIPAGQASVTVPLIPIDDTLVEPIETAVLTIQPSPSLYVVGTPSSATVNILDNDDTSPPTITAFTRPKIVAGANSPTFTVTYADASKVDITSFGNGNLLITGPKGYRQYAIFVSANATANAAAITATYRIITPGPTWDSTDNGTYTVYVQPNQVKDVYGNAMATQVAGTFPVTLAAPKKAAVKKVAAKKVAAKPLAAAKPFVFNTTTTIADLLA